MNSLSRSKNTSLYESNLLLSLIMSSFNQSIFHPAVFFLTGIPGFETYHAWISIPFSCLYAIAISGNGMILFVIITESNLHEPMYYFLSMLSFTDLGLCLSTLVTMLGIFWFNAQEINFNACISQMFFIHGFTFMESSVLLAMAFDRFTAISNPLRYATILTNSRIIKVGFVIIIRGTTALVPLLLLLKRLSFCHSHVLHHSYCFHPDVMKLSCTDTKINSAFGLAIVISTAGLDSVLILLSYVLIIHSVLSIASPEERKKAFGTCISHISAVAIFYIPMISLSLVHRFGEHAPPIVHTLIANVYLLIPPVMNPIIYSVKTKQIRKAVIKIFFSKLI
ncbi:olfactory receptor 51F2-like isoform X1 [Pteronotus mesoamericanus]|uniref:olfactory receptor 51F2-like isoform X1 n=1 Tax=Pteronotus mesoamericanus TaxID=1884717 RepID=UPI0023ECE213|nr:olfactory receptor 51F2-like isoform X1 [Pteronotus parnellii mesoamericanus]